MSVVSEERSTRDGSSSARPISTAIGLLVLRVALGAVFIAHGAQKIFTNGIAATTEGFTGMGIPLPSIAAPLVAYSELIGGSALILGVLARIAALALAITAFVALFVVHLPSGFFVATGGYELVMILGAACVAVLFTGAGAASIDGLFASRRGRRTR